MLNVWSYLRLPDACYLVVDRPCQSGTFTRWNYRPCSAAHPFNISRYYTDNWGAYERHFDPEMHEIGKTNTQKIERKNDPDMNCILLQILKDR